MTAKPVKPTDDRIVDIDLPDEPRVRRVEPITDLGEFLSFLDAVEALFGLTERRPTKGPKGRFLL